MSRLLTFPLSLILSLGILFSLNHCGSDDIPPLSGNPSSPGNVDPLGPKTKTDDHGNAQARATPVTNGMAVIGNIETDDDQDYFSIAVAGAGTLRAFTTGDVNTIGILYDSDGTELAKNNKDGADINFDISYDVTSAGIYYVRVTSPGTNTRTYSLTVTFTTAPDPFDDHSNTEAHATPVTSGMPIDGNLETRDDQDYFSIAVAGAGTLRAFTTGDVNTIGTLYDSDGAELASDVSVGNFNISHYINSITRTSMSTYYIRVTSFGGGEGEYSLTVIFISDDHRNDISRATVAASGMPIDGNLTRDDQDYFSIVVTGAGTLRAFTRGGVNTIGALYDSDGTELASDVSVGNFNISHYINSITRTSMSTYYIRVTSFGGGEGEYSLTVTFISDDHSNDISRATVVTSGMPIDGNLETRDDQDYFSIAVTGAGTLRAFTTGGVNTIGALYDNDGTELASDDDGGTDVNFAISHDITSAGTYYIRVTSFGGGEGEYSLTVTFISDDHSNDISRATVATSGMPIDGNLTRDDQDYFSIAVTGAGTLRAFTTGGVNTIGALYDSDGTELAFDASVGNFNISHYINSITRTSISTYYIRVTGFGGGEGEYSLTVTFISDDHSNTEAHATVVTSGMPIDGNLETRDGQDYFSIVVTGAGTLKAFTTGDVNTIGTLYDSDGTELASDVSVGNFNISYYINSITRTSISTYYIRVTGFGGGEGEYSLTVTFISDDHSNDISRATVVTSGMPIDGNLETSDDQDYFSIRVPRAGTIQASTTGMTNTLGYLYDSNGNELATNDDVGTDTNFNISYDVAGAGIYYIKVSSFETNTGMYNLTVTFRPDPVFMYPELNYSSCDGSIQITPTLTTNLNLSRISFTISPELPSGIQISSATGEISGMYSNYHSQSYVVKVLFDGMERTRTDLNIKINSVDQISYPQEAYQFTTNTAITLVATRDPSHSGVAFSVSPALPTGLSLDSSTGGITGNLASELGNKEHMVQVTSGSCSKQIPLRFCANEDGNCPPRFLPEKRIHYADVIARVFPSDTAINAMNQEARGPDAEILIGSLTRVKSFVDDSGDDFTITIMSQTNNNFHPKRPTHKYKYKYGERPFKPTDIAEESSDRKKIRELYLFDDNLTDITNNRWWDAEMHRLHKFTTDTVTLKATDTSGRSTVGTIEIRRSPKLKDCTGLTGDALDDCTWLSEILPSNWESNTLTDAVKNKLPNLTQAKDNYRLVFAEEFNGDGDSNNHYLDRKKWHITTREVWNNNPSAVRNDCFNRVKDGTLQMSVMASCPKGAVGLTTLGLFEYRYGYIEMKFKIPINKAHTSPGNGYYTNYAGVLWSRYGGPHYRASSPVTVDSVEKYLKYERVEWDLYEYVPRWRTIFAHWYYPHANHYNNFLIPETTINRIARLCRNQLSTARDPNPMTTNRRNQLKEESRKESTFLEGCNSAVPTTAAQAPAQDRFVTLTRGWEWTPKGYRNFSHYETDNENDKTRYPDLFSDSPKTSHWGMYEIKYKPYSNTSTFTRGATERRLRREAPYITSRDDNDQLLEIGVSHQPMTLDISAWAQGVWGGFVNPPAGTIYPHVFHIDYVRVYKPKDNYKDVAPSYQFTPTNNQSSCQVSGSSNC